MIILPQKTKKGKKSTEKRAFFPVSGPAKAVLLPGAIRVLEKIQKRLQEENAWN